jgi:MoaA/NifB/PqqE/SkfB family radical SAM enzyme
MSIGKTLALHVAKLIPFRGIGMGRWGTLGLAGIEYVTPAKLWNLVRCEYEKVRRVAYPKAFPYVAIIDVANKCNLRCPYCPTGLRLDGGRDKSFIDPLVVQQLVDEIGKYLLVCDFFNWGEPLLHPKIGELVEICHKAGIWTAISTNFNIRNKRVLEDLCDAGLDYLILSVDGATQESYEKYRNAGNFELVLENIAHIMDYRRRRNLQNPIVDWKYLVFKHNKHETRRAYEMAKELGVDIFRFRSGGGPEYATVEARGAENLKKRVLKQYCRQLWHAVIVNSDSGIAPCCFVFNKRDDFGDYRPSRLLDIRRNEKFVTARKLFDPSAVGDLPPDLKHTCLKCGLVHNQPHLREYLAANPNAVRDHRTGITYEDPDSSKPQDEVSSDAVGS